MFKKLRNNFLFLNLGALAIVIFIAFLSMIFLQYKQINSDINRQVEIASSSKNILFNSDNIIKNNDDSYKDKPPMSPSILLTKSNSEYVISDVNFLTNTSIVSDLSTKLNTINKKFGILNFNNNYWYYKHINSNNKDQIVVLQITTQFNLMRTMILGFIGIFIILMIILYFISRYFANRAIRPIEDAFYKQKTFISDASHELKTPLSVISSNLDVILSNKDELVKDQAIWINHVKNEVFRMSKLTNDLLYLAQTDSEKVNIAFVPFNISLLANNVSLSMEAIFFEKGIILETFIEDNLFINGNEDQIHQIFVILLDNAMKYSNEKKVIFSINSNNNKIYITVKNKVDNIPKDDLNKLFDRFYRVDNSRNKSTGGQGLGLSIASSLINNHSGKINATIDHNNIISFNITFPKSKIKSN